MTGPVGPALVTDRRSEVGRRRVAPKAIETSDVTRFRGVLLASIVGAVALVGILIASWAAGADVVATSSRPLSRPHRDAGLKCEQCHAEGYDRQSAASVCVTCHGPHPSARDGHAALASGGTLQCIDCHRTHDADNGVVFASDGSVVRYGHGNDRVVEAGPTVHLGDEAVTVPVPEASACAACHAIDDAQDPIAPCLLAGHDALGRARPVACFDEHRDVLTATAQARSAAWEAARTVVQDHPTVERADDDVAPGVGFAGVWVGSGFLAGLLTLGIHRVTVGLRRRQRKATDLPQHAVLPSKVVRLPQINTNTCIGCHACVDACPYDVLEVHNYVAQVIRPDDCCGLTLCEQRCPNGSLVITDGEPVEDRPHMGDDLQSLDSPGVYLAGDLTGLPLIRNAINQGTHVTRTIAAGLHQRGGQMVDLAIIGAGPAGMSAALEAKSQGLHYAVFEQGSLAESIRSFPRGKLVFDQPLGLPLIGDLWLEKSTKEELLAKWQRIVHLHQLSIYENHRVLGIDRVAGGPPQGHLLIRYVGPDGQQQAMPARRVLLAFGRRGSPRKLGVDIPDAALSHVHYSLADARSFAGSRVLVIGLGDVAMEAAIAMAKQPDTSVTVSYRGDGFKRGKTKNVEEVKRLARAGRIDLKLSTEVTRIDPGMVTLSSPGGPVPVECDAVFVMIGTIAPWQFLEACGVQRVTNAPTPPPPPPPQAPGTMLGG